ncbi:MAG: hypothetical protein HYT94_03980 [Parcubacteria group bacterium]|nr:hypothetical protein [Parcubacteria group bacterium]
MTQDANHNQDHSNKEELSPIERVEEKLYSRTDDVEQKDRTKLRPKKFTASEDWEGNEETLRFEKKERPSRVSAYTVAFLVSITFFIVAGGLAGYLLLSKKPAISPENVSVSAFGPVSIRGGDVLSLQVLVENKNSVALLDADVLVEFPGGTRYVNQPDKVLERFHKTIGTIAAGEIRTETIKAVVFGDEEKVKDVLVTVKYRIEGSGAQFAKTKEYTVTLTAPALSVKTNLVKETTAGQEVTLIADVLSSSASVVKQGLVAVEYPQGFIFKRATPAPSFGDNSWKLGDMSLGDTRRIEITGVMQGEDTEEKVFHIYTGIAKNSGSAAFDTIFSSLLQTLTLNKPFLGVRIEANGSADPGVVFDGSEAGKMTILWTNNFPDKVIDGQIEVSLKGSAIDPRTVRSGSGFFQSATNVISWDKRASGDLGLIPVGGQSSVGFSFGFLPFTPGNILAFKNPEVEFGVSVKGKRVSENNVPEEIKSFVTKKYKVGTTLQFSARNVYHVGPFANRGPLPPKANQETTYTVMWAIKNTVNDVSGATMKAVLSPSVEWKGAVSPNEANIAYNPASHEIVWNIGTIKAGAGYGLEPKEAAFQIGFTPSLSHIGDDPPELVSEAAFVGKDAFTGMSLGETLGSLSTELATDPQASSGDSIVVP